MGDKVQAMWTTAHESGTYLASLLLFFEGSSDKAKSLLGRIVTSSTTDSNVSSSSILLVSNYFQYLALFGWLEVLVGRDIKSAIQNFDKAILVDKSPEAYLGKAKFYEQRFTR